MNKNLKFNDISTEYLTKMIKNKKYINEIKFAIFAIKEGEHFTLPLNGKCLFDLNQIEAHENHLKYLQSPYPITILQYYISNQLVYSVDELGYLKTNEDDTKNNQEIKALVYIVSLKLLLNKNYIKFKETGANGLHTVKLSSVLSDPEDWFLLTQNVDTSLPIDGLLFRDKDFYIEHNSEENTHRFSIHKKNIIHVMLNEKTNITVNNNNNWADTSRCGLMSAFSTILDFYLTLNCRNVKIKNHIPSSNLNKIRRASNKPLYSEFKTLTIKGEDIGYYSSEERNRVERGPVKFHSRRGHLRHYKNGTILYIESMYVGRKDKGSIIKTYDIKNDTEH